MAATDAKEFRDPDNNDSLPVVVRKTIEKSIAKNLIQATQDVVNRAAAPAEAAPGQQGEDGCAVSSSGHEETDGPDASVVSRLVRELSADVSKVIECHRKELEDALELVIHLQGEQMNLGIKSIWDKMWRGKPFKWSYLITFLAFAALIVWRKGPGAELVTLARTVATWVGDLIVEMWRAAFVKLGGWFGFLKQQNVDGAADAALADRVGSATLYGVLLVAFAYGLYWTWKDFSSQPPKLE